MVEIVELRLALAEICLFLRELHGDVSLRKCADWHQHDGYISGSSYASWSEIDEALRSEASLHDFRSIIFWLVTFGFPAALAIVHVVAFLSKG